MAKLVLGMDEIILVMGMDGLGKDGGIEIKLGKLDEKFGVDGAVDEKHNLLDGFGWYYFGIYAIMDSKCNMLEQDKSWGAGFFSLLWEGKSMKRAEALLGLHIKVNR